jgi:hypothetical protein
MWATGQQGTASRSSSTCSPGERPADGSAGQCNAMHTARPGAAFH